MSNENNVKDLKQENEENQNEVQEYELEKELEEEEDDDRKYVIIFFIIALLLLIFIVIGFSFSIFGGGITGPSQPISAQVVFNYSDKTGADDGIHLTNARAISDSVGKKLMGDDETFEFSISGNNYSRIPIKYYIVLEEGKNSTLNASDIKVYLTSRKGNVEEEISKEVPLVSSLKKLEVGNISYRLLHQKGVPSNNKFFDNYTFRMWIKEDAKDYYGKHYSLKLNVYVEGKGAKDERD